MNETCGCCEGIERLTPIAIVNRPGLNALVYRVGTHASFLETMKACLPTQNIALKELGIPLAEFVDPDTKIYPLRGLTTRAADDPAIAMLDAWATVADVLTFYQERIANEGYLRTATERRSIQELGKLVGYTLRPGVAASVYLAYMLEKDQDTVLIPPGSRVQSVPDPGELPQTFETSEKLEAHFTSNILRQRMTQPQYITLEDHIIHVHSKEGVIYFQGTATNLKQGDPLLFVFGDPKANSQSTLPFAFLPISLVEIEAAHNRTKVTMYQEQNPEENGSPQPSIPTRIPSERVQWFATPPSPRYFYKPNVSQILSPISSVYIDATRFMIPELQRSLIPALANIQSSQPRLDILAFRVKAAPFGHNAPPQNPPSNGDWSLKGELYQNGMLPLDTVYERIIRGGWVVIVSSEKPDDPFYGRVDDVQTVSKVAYGIAGKVTQLKINPIVGPTNWLDHYLESSHSNPDLSVLRNITVYVQSESLGSQGFGKEPALAEEPIDEEDIGLSNRKKIELDGIYDGLKPGQFLIVSGERTDTKTDKKDAPIRGIWESECVRLARAELDVKEMQPGKEHLPLPGDKLHTFLILDIPLQHTYRRDTVTIYGNVVRATHGETRSEVLGSGDGTKTLQHFTLRQSPLTYTSAPIVAGAESTLEVRVNDILWHEADDLAALKAADRCYITEADESGKTTIIFGDGQHGSRVPSGFENIKAVYRTGIGKAGNVKAGQITLLATRPLGVKEVTNPQDATGGADKESLNSARRNVPLPLMALDRLVSVRDYEDFARTYAGIGKASAVHLADGRRRYIHLTIAGADNIPIAKTSDLYYNLFQSLRKFGDPNQPLWIDPYTPILVVIEARVRLLEDYQWESVESAIRTALLDTFGFERRELGQPMFQSEVLATIQGIAGVDYVELKVMGGVGSDDLMAALQKEEKGPDQFLSKLGLDHSADIPVHQAQNPPPPPPKQSSQPFLPAQLAFINSNVPETLILEEMTQ